MANASLRGRNVLLTFTPKRYASNASAAQKQPSQEQVQRLLLKREDLRVTKLPNGVVVASIENNSPITRVSAIVNVGARHEKHDTLGAAHVIRAASNLATGNFSSYGMSRTIDHLGGQFSVSTSKEQTHYNLVSSRDKFEKLGPFLRGVVCKPLFKSWEIENIRGRLDLELDVYNEAPEQKLVDYIHKAAFRGGLSNPVYASALNLDNLDSEKLLEFHQKNFSADRLTLVGLGIGHDYLLQFAESFKLPNSASDQNHSSKYFANEVRVDDYADLVHIAVACEGVALPSKDALASGVIKHAFGTGSRIKWSDGANRIANSVLPLASEPAMVNSFNINYSDTGLFGFHLITSSKDTGKVVRGVFKECAKVAKNGFSSEEIANAKYRLKSELAGLLESNESLVSSIGLSCDRVNFDDLSKKVDAISKDDVNSLAKRLCLSKPSMAAVGDLHNLPHIDELSP